MPDITNLIQTYYRLKMSQKLGAVIHQVDDIARFAIEVFEADFAALFYHRPGEDDIIPVAYCNADAVDTSNMFLLEQGVKGFVKEIKAGKAHQRWYQTGDSAAGIDQFAADNGLNAGYRYPRLVDGEVRTVVAVYWKEPPGNLPAEFDSLLELVSTMLISSMAVADDMAAVDNFSLKLCELLSVLEIPIGEYRFQDLVTRVVERSRLSIDNSGVCLLIQDDEHRELTIGDHFDDHSATLQFLRSIRTAVAKTIEERRDQCESGWDGLMDLHERVPDNNTAIIGADMNLDETHRYVLVTWTKSPDGFNDNDRHLFSAFCLFMQTVLRNALLVRSLRRSNRLLKKSANQMANLETLAALADMTSGLAHEFNNIIGGIVGRIQLMKMKADDSKLDTDLKKIESLAMEGAKTVKRIQEFSMGTKYKNMEPVDLCAIVTTCFDTNRATWQKVAAKKNIDVQRRFDAPEAYIEGSYDDLATAVTKLIENAVEHAPERTCVQVTVGHTNSNFVVTVADRGRGIAEPIKKKVFYPFFSTKNSPRAGLSLATVHGIVVRHGGKIDFQSDPETGTVFNLYFKRPESYDEISEITDRNKQDRQLQVLVVDDDEQIREILADMLAMDGHETISCPDARTALKSLEQQSFDLMITDLGMPGMSGLELAGVAHKQYPELPIAMITGWGTQLNEDEVAHNGVQKILAKPFHLRDVKSVLKDLVHE